MASLRVAYVDTSCLLAVVLDQPGAERVAKRLAQFDRLVSSNLLEAELRSVMAREKIQVEVGPLFRGIDWIHPNRPLTAEFHRVLASGYLKGADLWHLACALFVAPDPEALSFLTLDERQQRVASKLGFAP